MQPLVRQDITDAANVLGCEDAAICALMTVEAAGSGFDAQGRPTILFEPHLAEREARKLWQVPKGETPDWIAAARANGLMSPKWNKALYPKTADGRWAQFHAVYAINPEVACKSASFGLGQIIGANHAACGYATAVEYVEAISKSEQQQVLAFASFVMSNHHLHDALLAHDWATFARIYNGPGQVEMYSHKLEAAYNACAADPEHFWATRPNHGRAEASIHADVDDI